MSSTDVNIQIWRDLAEIADSEPLMKQLARYLRKLVAKKADQTLMTEEEFYSKLEKGEKEYHEGKCTRLQPGESVTEMLRRSGYDV